MKLQITFKTPDAVHYALEDYFRYKEEMTGDERDDVTDEVKALTDQYISDDEYITVEFDTEAKTAVVIKN